MSAGRLVSLNGTDVTAHVNSAVLMDGKLTLDGDGELGEVLWQLVGAVIPVITRAGPGPTSPKNPAHAFHALVARCRSWDGMTVAELLVTEPRKDEGGKGE